VAEAATLLQTPARDNDIVVCVQGDEPMMRPDMIDSVIAPLLRDEKIPATILAMHIVDKNLWLNPDTVKLVYNASGEVLYTSRAPVPYCKAEFTPEFEARRIYGIFAFRWKFLRAFTEHQETRLERLEACDSNRILDMSFRQYIAPYPNLPSFSVDSPSDIGLVEQHMKTDDLWAKYA
jgi:3-deoxy-manno-octulosonate cytidylyltransferase (CMP-KDO synthetase)